jgi:pSer/pThr/pTyr-binding forkhead associated (FHA) protein
MRHPLEPPGIVVGRGTDADLRINDPGVSRRHAEIRVDAHGRSGIDVSVVDLGSTNGMLVNGRRVQQAALEDGATIKLGNTTMRVRFVLHDQGHDQGHDEGEAGEQPDRRWGGGGV